MHFKCAVEIKFIVIYLILQMQELEQRTQEAERRAQTAEDKVDSFFLLIIFSVVWSSLMFRDH